MIVFGCVFIAHGRHGPPLPDRDLLIDHLREFNARNRRLCRLHAENAEIKAQLNKQIEHIRMFSSETEARNSAIEIVTAIRPPQPANHASRDMLKTIISKMIKPELDSVRLELDSEKAKSQKLFSSNRHLEGQLQKIQGFELDEFALKKTYTKRQRKTETRWKVMYEFSKVISLRPG